MKRGNGQRQFVLGAACVLPLPWSRRWKLTVAACLCLLELRLTAEPTRTLGESALHKAFCSWALIDLARAIARESRPHIARALVKSHLALYGCLYGLSNSQERLMPTESFKTLNLLLSALAFATHDLLQEPRSAEEWSAQVVIDETVALWEPIRASLLPAPSAGKP